MLSNEHGTPNKSDLCKWGQFERANPILTRLNIIQSNHARNANEAKVKQLMLSNPKEPHGTLNDPKEP